MFKDKQGSNDLGSKLIHGALWMVAMRWLMRFIGLFSMAIVARLLAPADFGIFAIAVTFIGLLDAVTDIGTDLAIIRHPNPQQKHYDTAWTLQIIMRSSMAAVIVLAAPLAVHIYGDSRYLGVLSVLAFSLFISGFGNIGIANFRRDMQFHKDFQNSVMVQIVGVTATIGFAFLLHSYWALVLGGLARSVFGTLLSYLMHPYRPKFSLSARHEILGFSFWTMIRSVAIFLSGKGDRLVIGAFYGTSTIGWYAVSGDLAGMAVFELLHPISRALFPGMALKQGDAEWEGRNLVKIYNGAATISVAAGVGLAALALPSLLVVYGDHFAAAAPMLQIIALQSAVAGFIQPLGQYFVVLGKTRELAILYMLQGIVSLGISYLLASQNADIQTIIYAQLGINCLALLRLFFLLRFIKSLGWRDIVIAWTRPLIAGAVMYSALTTLQRETSFSHGVDLIIGIPVGATVFCGTLIAVWNLMGRPPGIEGELITRIWHSKGTT